MTCNDGILVLKGHFSTSEATFVDDNHIEIITLGFIRM